MPLRRPAEAHDRVRAAEDRTIGASVVNADLALAVDALGRIVSLRNRRTRTQLIAYPQACEAWRMVLPSGRHTVDFVYGSKQKPPSIRLEQGEGYRSIVIDYPALHDGHNVIPVSASFVLTLRDEPAQVTASCEIDNRSERTIDEVEFPVVGGLGGFAWRGRRLMNLAAGDDGGALYDDVLSRGLPDTGFEANHFVREHETAFFEPATVEGGGYAGARKRGWLDFWSEAQGLYLAYLGDAATDYAFKVERYPKAAPHGPAHYYQRIVGAGYQLVPAPEGYAARPAHDYPDGTPVWLRVAGLHVPRLGPGQRWTSQPVTIMPHRGDWHTGADHYAARRHAEITRATPPAWLDNMAGWTEILGKTYLGEVFHDYARCADEIVKDKAVTGLDFVFYYGHSILGAEGADYDHSPAPDLGGQAGFRQMVDTLHANGCHIMLLDHMHRWLNRDIPEYAAMGMERFAVLDADGRPVTARWWKETFLSCRRLEGPTPVWVEMCPACPEYLGHYVRHVERVVGMGADGLELDTFLPSRCYNPNHGHPVGAYLLDAKLEFVRAAREHAKRLNPDFAIVGETMSPAARAVLDGYYAGRYLDEFGRVHRYLFPELTQQTVLVGNYGYDAMNKALALGLGIETEIWGLRKTALAGCPELARYIGEVTRFRRQYGDTLIHGTFRDTVGARVAGRIVYGVLGGPQGRRALVLRNPGDQPRRVTAALAGVRAGRRLCLWQPFAGETPVERQPVTVALGPHGVAVLLAV